MKQVYLCEKCGSLWPSEMEANKCERAHKEIKSVEILKWCQHPNKLFPLILLVKIAEPDELEWDYAIYRLERIGPRGV